LKVTTYTASIGIANFNLVQMSSRRGPAKRSGQSGSGSFDKNKGGGHEQGARKMVGNYILGKTIGEGTFGKVTIAVHIPTKEKVAVKILEKSRIKEQADIRRVNREIKILKKNRHPNIIQLYEVLDTQNSVYLIMENADGGEMFDYIVAHRHVPERQACIFFHQIIDGIEVLHQSEVTHRDLKPENLLLKSTPNGWIVKIVDFGLSNTHEGGRLLSTACGSPCYAAPEMIAGKKYFGPLADIWSCGVILFALVCGYLPFEDPNTSALYKKIMSGQYKPAKWISGEVRDLIRKILETDPDKRYQIHDIRRHQWYTQVNEEDVPKDIVSLKDAELAQAEAMRGIVSAGLETQAVIDGLSSRVCNSATATYFLLEQKAKRQYAKLKSDPSSIAVSFSNSSVSGAIAPTDIGVSATSAASRASVSGGSDGQMSASSNEPLPKIVSKDVHSTQQTTTTTVLSAVGKPPSGRVPPLNLQEAQGKPPLVSQSARPIRESSPPIIGDIQETISKSARDATPGEVYQLTVGLDALKVGDMYGDVPAGTTNVEPIITFGIPDQDEARPATRRSRMRSRNGTSNTPSEANMYAPAGFDDSDAIQNVPITITTDGAGMLPATLINEAVKFPPSKAIQIQNSKVRHVPAPAAPKPSSFKGGGGRRGKNIAGIPRSSLRP
jgi:5'-AMP-activated protein kinase, catalytic alpha subunit